MLNTYPDIYAGLRHRLSAILRQLGPLYLRRLQILPQTSADVMISCAPRLHSYLVSQQATEPSLLTPQVWTALALTETKEVTDGVGHRVAVG